MYYDWTYLLIILGVMICGIASMVMKSTFQKYSLFSAESKLKSEDAARQILDAKGLIGVSITSIEGNLTDHYDTKNEILSLSESVYGDDSIAAICVAAHECGHAMQAREEYRPLILRHQLVPIVNICSNAAVPVIILGFLLGLEKTMVPFGIALFSAAVLFHLITLPVEFNASARAVRVLTSQGILTRKEIPMAKKVLQAAALTYVASTLASMLQLLRLIMITKKKK